MSRNWTQLQGLTIDQKFELVDFLGGSDRSGVFSTRLGTDYPQGAALKLIVAGPEAIETLLKRWEIAAKLNHPRLVRLFHFGKCSVANESFAYVVMENADEDLSMILPSRSLTAEETREMLPAVLDGLEYIHSEGLVHGHIKPSNIMAVADQVKLSSDGITPIESQGISLASGSSRISDNTSGRLSQARDLRDLGVALVEVLTQHRPVSDAGSDKTVVPRTIPSAMRVFIDECLNYDPRKPPTIATVRHALLPPVAAPASMSPADKSAPAENPRTSSFRIGSFVALSVLLVVLVGWMLWPGHAKMTPSPPAQPAQTVSVAVPPASVPVLADSPGKVAHEVLPDVSSGARRTIRGTIRVKIRISADSSGAVRNIRMEAAGQSRYFANKASEAARQWTFEPPASKGETVPSDWSLEFQFRRSGTQAHARRIS